MNVISKNNSFRYKTKSIAFGICLGLAVAAPVKAQWAVIDVASIAQLIEQIRQMEAQIKQAKAQYEALTGARGFGDLFNDPALRDYLPEDWTDLYDAIQRGDIAGISGRVDELMAATQEGTIEDMSNEIAERRARLGAVNHAVGEAGFEAALKRTEQIQHLIEEISHTEDPKGIAELQARIAGEQAAVSNEIAKLQLVAMLQQAEEQMIDARAKALFQKQMTGSRAVAPLPSAEELLQGRSRPQSSQH